MTLSLNSLLSRECYACCEQTTELRNLESRGFHYKVALYLSYLHIKFDDEFQAQSLIPLRPNKLTSRLFYIYSQTGRVYFQIRPSYDPQASHRRLARRKQHCMGRQWGLYTVIYTSNKSSKHVLTVALTTHTAMSLRYKFDDNMKNDSKLLIIEATFGFCLFC